VRQPQPNWLTRFIINLASRCSAISSTILTIDCPPDLRCGYSCLRATSQLVRDGDHSQVTNHSLFTEPIDCSHPGLRSPSMPLGPAERLWDRPGSLCSKPPHLGLTDNSLCSCGELQTMSHLLTPVDKVFRWSTGPTLCWWRCCSLLSGWTVAEYTKNKTTEPRRLCYWNNAKMQAATVITHKAVTRHSNCWHNRPGCRLVGACISNVKQLTGHLPWLCTLAYVQVGRPFTGLCPTLTICQTLKYR